MSEEEVNELNPGNEANPGLDGYIIGRCKWFNNQKAFGFIELPGGGLDIFVHANQLRKSGIDRVLLQGEMVKFQTSKGPKGSFAINISIIPNKTP